MNRYALRMNQTDVITHDLDWVLYCACRDDDLKMIKQLIEKGADAFMCITTEQCSQLLNMGVDMNRHKDTIYLKDCRERQIYKVKDHFDQLKYPYWDHNIITQIICEYMPYEENI